MIESSPCVSKSTHPHKVQPTRQPLECGYSRFNPRTHVRCDSVTTWLTGHSSRFQPTHPRKVRQKSATDEANKNLVSTHAPGTAPFAVLYLHTVQLNGCVIEIKFSIEVIPIPSAIESFASAPNCPLLAFPLSYFIQFQLHRANGLLCVSLIS